MFKPTKPVRPYANLNAFVEQLTRWTAFNQKCPGKWPCLECEGSGIIWDPNDPPDPIEGNKLRNRIKCPTCKGSRTGTRQTVMAAYKEQIRRYEKNLAEWNRLTAARASALKKLSKEEIEALDRMGVK